MKKVSIPSIVLEELEASGLPWAIEVGGKHHKIKIEGRLAGVLPRSLGSVDARAVLNTRAQVRRTVAMLQGQR